MTTRKRTQLFVDRKVQGELMQRTIMYWLFCLLALSLMVLCWRILTQPVQLSSEHFREMWQFYGPAVIASLLLLPIVVVDIIRMSNRFAGPLHRLRREMSRLANGEHAEPIYFRENDYWADFADDYNKILAQLQGEQGTQDTLKLDDTVGGEAEPSHYESSEPDEEQFVQPLHG